jgi:hypothetical protein
MINKGRLGGTQNSFGNAMGGIAGSVAGKLPIKTPKRITSTKKPMASDLLGEKKTSFGMALRGMQKK